MAKDLVSTLWRKSKKSEREFEGEEVHARAVCIDLKRKGLQIGHLQALGNERDGDSEKALTSCQACFV
jgi:hypothetical protein